VNAFESEFFEMFGKEPDGFRAGNGIGEVRQSEKDAKRNTVADLFFDSLSKKPN